MSPTGNIYIYRLYFFIQTKLKTLINYVGEIVVGSVSALNEELWGVSPGHH